MKKLISLFSVFMGMASFFVAAAESSVSISSPGFAASQVDAKGRLVEDWGAVEITLEGGDLNPGPQPKVTSVKIDNLIPTAQARSDYGAVSLTLTAFRAPAFPAGVDVLTARLESREAKDMRVKMRVTLPENVRIGSRTAQIGGRTVLLLPQAGQREQEMRDFGWADDAVSLRGWARPASKCDPAFANIRAGVQAVPIHYRFKVDPKSSRKVVLGFCESHWSATGSRPVICKVEGAAVKDVDPLAIWGRHMPGAVEFEANDADGNGIIEVSVLPKPGAPDANPILNVLWVFDAHQNLDVAKVITGQLNDQALHYIDVGGDHDQSLYAGGAVEYDIVVPPAGMQMEFIAAPPHSSVPQPGATAWTSEKLRKAALEVWRDWRL